jgi:hypothetical protein
LDEDRATAHLLDMAGATTPAWQRHRPTTDEKWIVPMGSNVPFYVDPVSADISVVVSFWPRLVPKPWFMDLREIESRFVIHNQPDGQRIWVAAPKD